MFRRCIFIGCLMLAASCSHVDTGQIDYRIAETTANPQDCPPESGGGCRLSQLNRRYAQPAEAPAFQMPTTRDGTGNETGVPSADAGAVAGAAPALPLEAGSLFSINVEQVVIGKTLLEGVVLGREFGPDAEFIILANVFELGGSDGTSVRFLESFEYRPASGQAPPNQLRVVHYAANVKRHQPLNFSNIPLLTARRYNGRSVAIQIVILEVDLRSSSLSNMLTTLADLGRGALPVPAGGERLLQDLGQSLFTGRGDDTIFDYRFVLSPPGPEPGAMQPVLAPGRYVLRRSQNRRVAMNWNELRLDHNTARLYKWDGTKWVEARDELYLVLNIQQLPSNYPEEHLGSMTWATAYDALQAQADDPTTPVNILANNISTVVPSMMMRDELLDAWEQAETRLRAVERLYTIPEALGCAPASEEQRLRSWGLVESDAHDALDRFLRLYKSLPYSPTGDRKGAEAGFRMQDRTPVASAVRRYHIPIAEEKKAHFATPEAFEAHYLAESQGQAFIEETLARAKKRQNPATNCSQLIAQGAARRN